MIDKKVLKPSCSYAGELATGEMFVDDPRAPNGKRLVKVKGDIIIGRCVEGRIWKALPEGINYVDCPGHDERLITDKAEAEASRILAEEKALEDAMIELEVAKAREKVQKQIAKDKEAKAKVEAK